MKKYAGKKVLAEKLVEKKKAKGIAMSFKEAEDRIKEDIDLMKEVLSSGEFDGLQFIDFMTLELVIRAARQGRNPRTKEVINIPEKTSVKAKLGASFEKELN